ncbi:MAG TPA: hypothetical protein VNT60_10580 [Deinococcales bacterium]|nr:hypothetical protein [Deinococcales bacterium]
MLNRLRSLALAAALLGAGSGVNAQTTAPAAPSVKYTLASPAFQPLAGARVYHGTRNGYSFQMEVPANWNGELVMWAHGYQGTGTTLRVSPPPGREALVAGGFAWAASSFSANGWAVRAGSDDTLDLTRHFAATVGAPKRTYLVGASMGGNVVTDSLEAYPDAYQGALSLCGVMTGTELFDYFLSYNLAAQYFLGKQWNLNVQQDPTPFLREIAGLNAILGQPGNYTLRGKQFDSVIKNLSGGERPFRIEGLNAVFAAGVTYYYMPLGTPLSGIINLAPGRQVATNANTVYQVDPDLGLASESVNAGVRRVQPNTAVRNAGRTAGYSVPTGNIRVPHLSLHTTGDAFVPIGLQVSYRRKVDAAGKGDLLVQRAIRAPGHCDFTQEEVLQGFNDLVRWVREGVKPRGEDFTKSLADAGREWTRPLRPGDPGNK